ncbi:MAG TPA: hypothetical protein VGQ83_01795, partial [Polyangia bacterium]
MASRHSARCVSSSTMGAGLITVAAALGLAACAGERTAPPEVARTQAAVTSTASTSTSSAATKAPYQRKAFYANGRYWVFYSDGTNIIYQTSTDGTTWAAKITVRAGTAGTQFALDFDGANLHYAYTSETANAAIYYRRGSANADGSVTWAAAEQTAVAAGGTTITYSKPTIAADSNGYPFIGYAYAAPSLSVRVTKASTNTGTWTTASGFPYNPGGNGTVTVAVPVRLLAGRMLILTGGNYVASRLWTGTAWASLVSLASNWAYGSSAGLSAVAEGDNAHLAFVSGGSAIYVQWTYSAANTTYYGSWGTDTPALQSGVPVGSAAAITRHLATGELYYFWAGYPTANHIYYKKRSAAGGWDTSATDWLNEATELLTSTSGLTAFSEGAPTGPVGVLYATKTASPYNIKLGTLAVTPTPKSVAGLRLWVEASTGLTMNGTGVATWADQSGTGNHLTQATASRQPTVVANAINGRPALATAAAAQQTMTVATNFPAPVTVIYVAQMSGTTRGRILNGLANNWLLGWWNAAEDKAYHEGWISPSTLSPTATANPYLYSSVSTGALTTIFRGGAQLYSNAGGVVGPNGLSLSGYMPTQVEFSDARIAEVLVYGGALSAADRQAVEAYLTAKYRLAGACGNGVPEAGEQCDLGASNGAPGSCCTASCTWAAAGTTCRAAAGPCDAAETCTGTEAACPADARVAAGTVCRAAAGTCDVAETCDGIAAACPADSVKDDRTICRPAAGPCDVFETCNGVSGACPPDALVPAGEVCRAAAGPCDVAETCTGSAATCPADALAAAGTTCRAAVGPCDVAEVCTGSAASCPADALVAAGMTCRAAAGACDVAETCNGASGACPADARRAEGALCTGGTCAGGLCQVQADSPSAHLAQHTCVIVPGGTVKCWGMGNSGQLGEGNNLDRGAPVVVAGVTNARSLAVGGYHACAVLTDDTMKCWGSNTYGQLGD